MKLQVTQENLNNALHIVGRVAQTNKQALPVLQNILISTNENQLKLSATNLEIAVSVSIGAKVERNGAITIPARLSQELLNNLPSEPITIELENNHLHLTTKNFNSTINGISADEFPALPKLTTPNTITIPANTLRSAISQVIFTASSDDTRPVLASVWFHTYQDNLYMVATDSYRLAEKRIMPCKEDISLLIPTTALQDMLRILPDSDEQITIQYNDQQISFKTNNIELISRLIDGTYPDYRQLIPTKFKTTATLHKDELINIVKVSSLFARESAGSVKIEVSKEKSQLEVISVASQVGENTATTTALATGDISVSLNSRYIIDALGAINEGEVSFSCDGKTSPCVIRPIVKKEDPDYTHVIMPLRS